jgi:hypothetical protein
MSDMSDSPAHARAEAKGWTAPQVALAGFLVLLGLGITGIAFYVMWGTVVDAVRTYMHGRSWTVPVSGEIAFLFLYLVGVLVAWRKAPAGVTRGLLMAGLIAGSVVLNVYAARGVLPDLVAHLLIVGSFFGVLIAGKAAITSMRGGKIRADRISGGEWAVHPLRSLALTRWMQTWGEPSRSAAHARYMVLLYARAVTQADSRVGRVPVLWRRRLPVTLRYQLSTGLLPEDIMAGQGDWQEALREHVKGQLSFLAEGTSGGTAENTTESISGNSGDTMEGRRERRREDTSGRNAWPETKDINRAVLLRRVRAADERWQRSHGGKLLPAVHLSAQLQVRMNRETAGELLTEARAGNRDSRQDNAREG